MKNLAENWPYKPGLEYTPPARGTWTIAHTPLLVPESVEVYVCPESCLRGVSLSAAEFGGLGTRFSLVVVEEEDWIRSRMEPLFIEGVSDLLRQRYERDGKYPPLCFVFNSCMHQFMDTNMALIFRKLAERFPDVLFVEGNMNCTMRTTQTHYEAATNRALYKGLLPVGDVHRHAPVATAPSVNVIGNYFAIDPSSELLELLGFAGYKVNDLPRVKTYEEYQQMADASLNIYTHPFGKTACEDLKKRLGTPFLEVPYCWDFDEIEAAERAVLEKVATAINASGAGERVGLTPIVRAGLLDPYKYEAEQALAETAKALSGWDITIDAASTPRPFGLAALLESCGFRVTTVFADACGPLDEEAKAQWESLATEHGHDATTLPMIDWRMRSERPEDLFEPDMQVLAIGQKAAYYSGTGHFVNLIYQSGLLGFRGITKLCALIQDAAENEKDTETVLSVKAIGSAEAVAEGLARSEAGGCVTKTGEETPVDRPREADQASLYAVNYSSDLSGVCSALYELGGLLVMHDASGCNSTYATHDEPRWYGSDSLIFISGLREYDAILGNDEKYISDVVEAAKETHPTFIAVFGSPIAAMTGTDFKGVARVIEKRSGIPTLHFDTSGMHTYQAGMRQAFKALAERFVDEPATETPAELDIDCKAGRCYFDAKSDAIIEKQKRQTSDASLKVNLLGLTPLDFSVVGNVEALLDWCADNHFDVVSSWAMNANDKSGELRTNALGELLASLPAIARSAEADINLVLSSTALDAAKALQERFGTPYVVGLPMGDAACARMADLLKEAALTGVSKTLWETEAADAEGATGAHTLIIGEPVYAASLRWVLEQGASCALTGPVAGPASDVQILCPLEDPCGCLRNTDLQSWREPVIKAVLAEADVIYADPLYRNLLPVGSLEGTSPKEFHDVPSENYSGRMYRDQMKVFLGTEPETE